MTRAILVLAAIGVTIYAVIDCLRSDDAEIRGLPKPLWLLLIVAFPLFGGVIYILLGRQPTPGSPTSRRLRTMGPDDDPDFLRSLDPPRSHDKGDKDDGDPPPP